MFPLTIVLATQANSALPFGGIYKIVVLDDIRGPQGLYAFSNTKVY
jgi:hypothetical protein